MGFSVPENAVEIDNRAKVDISRSLPSSNPFLKNSWLGALVSAFSNRIYDFYYALRRAESESIPDTAIDRLEQWAAIWGILREPSLRATGNIAIVGATDANTIIKGTLLSATNGDEYETTSDVTLAAVSINITSITRIGSTATVTFASEHMFASNVLVKVTGAVQTEYNVTVAPIIVTGAKTLTYQVTGTPATPATGTILLEVDAVYGNPGFASAPIQSVAFGEKFNIVADSELTITTVDTFVIQTSRVDFGAVENGSDIESDEGVKNRLLYSIRNPIANFNVSQITVTAKDVPGVTRVFVEEITPGVGQVTVYFMRDNDAIIIPDSTEVAAVKAALDAIRPATSDTLDLIVSAPTAVSVPFTFTDVQPSDDSMKLAITESLKELFTDRTYVSADIDADAYRSAIFNSVDTVTGNQVTTFTLSTPTTDITIAAGQIGTLGSIIYP